jgi:hypothetical protein
MTEVNIMTQTPGLVIFDPVELAAFLARHQVQGPNVLERFIQDPDLGDEAISTGYLLPIYRIPAWAEPRPRDARGSAQCTGHVGAVCNACLCVARH